jgi:hypothetical protein
MKIIPKRDVYGTAARVSALADYCELVALKTRQALRYEEIQDRLRDAGIVLPPERLTDNLLRLEFESEEDEPADAEPPGPDQRYADSTQRIFDLLHERKRILDERYPFEVSVDSIAARPSAVAHEPYLALLAITTAHAHAIPTANDPKKVFEGVVARVFKERGWLAHNVGGEGSAGFVEALRVACAECKLVPYFDDVLLSVKARDENVDTLAHLHWKDERVGKWVFIGQATLEKSDGWERKLDEPKPRTWLKLLRAGAEPIAFLAVPHHVETLHFKKLIEDSGRLVLDRLRLVNGMAAISGEECVILDTVLRADVEYR